MSGDNGSNSTPQLLFQHVLPSTGTISLQNASWRKNNTQSIIIIR